MEFIDSLLLALVELVGAVHRHLAFYRLLEFNAVDLLLMGLVAFMIGGAVSILAFNGVGVRRGRGF